METEWRKMKEKARKLDISEEEESFIDLYAKRCADFNGMENASATDEEFLKGHRGLS
ncbi:TPA: hypothetical protein K8G96_000411 [Listeria monocytogenes]|uniref:hypothetical protein n=1 Tax=Listeria monocytogenes TaxID=1639 RepID=UPI0015C2E286|nr:hypothetical protein [Listeria monocytogenes]HBI5929772.1 hypothetical protein [Listeria monocytogenes]HBI6624568.1 hypothetical protein [Listeria monocytogenes]